ncbi:hypothetical protein [Bacillus sp. RAR_GA_16]|uniref:hypothetical protein n=1 Tax=Bacillus sp. RAR_GA_16 TaxID=2876774 RepID=UPI001CCC6CF8|nr:hypothetical protein [Bacillus sp. RAR_GA_16]MCA0174638.1 hypothetical protein [Bacillus sp. RAR_GA_16]
MKTNWERNQAIIHLPEEAITSIVKSYQPHARISATSYLSGGLSHTNLKVDILNEKPTSYQSDATHRIVKERGKTHEDRFYSPREYIME